MFTILHLVLYASLSFRLGKKLHVHIIWHKEKTEGHYADSEWKHLFCNPTPTSTPPCTLCSWSHSYHNEPTSLCHTQWSHAVVSTYLDLWYIALLYFGWVGGTISCCELSWTLVSWMDGGLCVWNEVPLCFLTEQNKIWMGISEWRWVHGWAMNKWNKSKSGTCS